MTSTLKIGSKIPISEIEGDISDASGMSSFLYDNMTKLSKAGKEAVFNGITVDLSSGVSISNNGAMPFDGWLKSGKKNINLDRQIIRGINNAD